MSKSASISIGLALLLTAAPAFAKPSGHTSTVTGNNKTINVVQHNNINNIALNVIGNNDTVNVHQIGKINTANIDTTGANDTVNISQIGRVNFASVNQTGLGDTANVGQIGGVNVAVVGQYGVEDAVNVFQAGRLRRHTIEPAEFNFAAITQTGDRFADTVTQVGRTNIAMISITGFPPAKPQTLSTVGCRFRETFCTAP